MGFAEFSQPPLCQAVPPARARKGSTWMLHVRFLSATNNLKQPFWSRIKLELCHSHFKHEQKEMLPVMDSQDNLPKLRSVLASDLDDLRPLHVEGSSQENAIIANNLSGTTIVPTYEPTTFTDFEKELTSLTGMFKEFIDYNMNKDCAESSFTCTQTKELSESNSPRVNKRTKGSSLSFYRIPFGTSEESLALRHRWIATMRREKWTEKQIDNARICSAHFINASEGNFNDSLMTDDGDEEPNMAIGFESNVDIPNETDADSIPTMSKDVSSQSKVDKEAQTENQASSGFTISEELATRGATLKIPEFTKGKSQMSAKEEDVSRKLSNVRIHVERVIGRLRKFRILQSTIPIT
eukprot:gene4033-20208_t